MNKLILAKIKINGLPPHEYAGLWGSPDHDGAYFYNYGAESCEKTAKWLNEFIVVIERQIAQVEKVGEGKGDFQFEKGSTQELRKLLRFVRYHYKIQERSEYITRMCGVPV